MPCIIEHPSLSPLPLPHEFSGRSILIIKHNLFIPVKQVNVHVKGGEDSESPTSVRSKLTTTRIRLDQVLLLNEF